MNNIVGIDHHPEFSVRKSPQAGTRFTGREMEILGLGHLKQVEIAEELGIAAETVRTHQKRIRLKLGAETWTAAMLAWMGREERRAA